jgi:hypothetical protein
MCDFPLGQCPDSFFFLTGYYPMRQRVQPVTPCRTVSVRYAFGSQVLILRNSFMHYNIPVRFDTVRGRRMVNIGPYVRPLYGRIFVIRICGRHLAFSAIILIPLISPFLNSFPFSTYPTGAT